jgi:hypothetical protein
VDDQTVERGDIVVTEERAKQLSQPRFDAQGKPVNLDPNPARPSAAPKGPNANVGTAGAATPTPAPTAQPAPPPAAEQPVEQDPSKRKVRSVGPTFYPVR